MADCPADMACGLRSGPPASSGAPVSIETRKTAHKAAPSMRSIRSPRTSSALLLLLLCTATGLHAQAPAASASVSDRAARDAHNPMRVILEAGRLKVRVKQEAAEAPAAAPRK